ncbi:hypothetical protein D1872_145650 [compost metagenome]
MRVYQMKKRGLKPKQNKVNIEQVNIHVTQKQEVKQTTMPSTKGDKCAYLVGLASKYLEHLTGCGHKPHPRHPLSPTEIKFVLNLMQTAIDMRYVENKK